MTLILSGTDGLSDVDGSAATPAIRGTDANTGIFFGTDIIGFSEGGAEVARFNADSQFVAAAGTAALPVITTTGDVNTGIFFPAADTIAFAEGGTEAMRIDSSGNVGIGTSSPGERLHIKSSVAGVYLKMEDSTGTAFVGCNASALQFLTGSTERARIDSSGNLLVGTTTTAYGTISGRFISASPTSGGAGLFYTGFSGDVSTSALNVGKFDNNSTTSQIFIKFGINNAGLGSGQINANGSSAAAFGSFSDSRLKENIVDLPSQLDNIMALRTVEFDYIESEGGGHQIGFIAQEVQEIYPDLVGEREDGMLTLTDLNKNDARLIKAIQELKALVDGQAVLIATQASTITALQADVEALKAQP